jgi:hypothetical protein
MQLTFKYADDLFPGRQSLRSTVRLCSSGSAEKVWVGVMTAEWSVLMTRGKKRRKVRYDRYERSFPTHCNVKRSRSVGSVNSGCGSCYDHEFGHTHSSGSGRWIEDRFSHSTAGNNIQASQRIAPRMMYLARAGNCAAACGIWAKGTF